MQKMINRTRIEGYVYEHKLEKKISGENSKNPGTEFITGTLNIATDEECLNIVPVHFTYVTALTAKGNPNRTFTILDMICEEKIGTVIKDGKDNAGMIAVDSALDLNEWYDKENNLISVKRNEGGFVSSINALNDNAAARATFEVDVVINGCVRKEADEERGLPERMTLKCAAFNFRNALLPMEFTVLNPSAMDYYESLEASTKNPIFTKIKGQQISQTIIRRVEEESAWGEISVRETKSSQKDFVVTWGAREPYVWDDETTILASELAEAVANREIYKAELKRRQEEYQASKNKPATPVAGAYNF